MEISSFAVVPLRSSSEQFGLATWQGRDVPAVGVVILSKDDTITDADIERLMPFATQAGTALVRASDVERLQDSSEQHAVEKEWLFWMVNGFADPVILTDANNDIILQNVRAQTLFKANPDDSEGKRRAIWMNNFLFTAALSTSKLEQNAAGRSAHDLTLVDPIEGTELLFEMRTLPATNYFNGARGTVAVLTNITDLRHATEQVTQNVHRLQTAEEEIRLERDRLNLIMRSVPNPIILLDIDNQPILMNHEALRLFQASALDSHRSRRAQLCISNEAKFTSFVSQLRLDPAPGMIAEIVLTDPDTREPLTMSVTSTEVRDELGTVAATVSVMQDVSRLRELERRRHRADPVRLREAGRDRSSGGVDRARDQQPPRSDQERAVPAHQQDPGRRSERQIPADRDQRDRSRVAHSASDAGLLPGAQDGADRHQPVDRRVRSADRKAPQAEPRQDRKRSRCAATAGDRFGGPDQTGAAEPDAQRAAGDAGRRHDLRLDARVARRRSRIPDVRFGAYPDPRYRQGHRRREPAAYLRAILLDEGRKGHGPRSVGVAGHRAGAWRLDQAAQSRRVGARRSASRCPSEDRPSMASGNLLVVDDEESVAVTMGAILEMDGYNVAVSMSGADALKRIRETSFDLVLTDLRLDDIDGLSIVSEICRVQPETVSIILTGYASLESAIKALREGAYDYLIKPCDVDELRAVVARGIERRQLGLQLKERLAELETANADDSRDESRPATARRRGDGPAPGAEHARAGRPRSNSCRRSTDSSRASCRWPRTSSRRR